MFRTVLVTVAVTHRIIAASCLMPQVGDNGRSIRRGRRHREGSNRQRTVIEKLPKFQAVSAAPAQTTALWLSPQQLGEFEPVGASDAEKEFRRVQLYDYSAEAPISFQEMWDMQKALLDGHLDRLTSELKIQKQGRTAPAMSQFVSTERGDSWEEGDNEVVLPNDLTGAVVSGEAIGGHDRIIMLQHEPVYTLGTGSDLNFIKSASEGGLSNVDIVRIERGGEVTYHGPGQLVVYPILDLRGYCQDIHWYMRALEEAILIALKSAGVEGAVREDDVTGVWVMGKKVAALGIKARRWVTMHGLAVNVDQRSLANFEGIVPCGLVGRDVCCINDHLREPISVEDFADHMKYALERVFEIQLVTCQLK